MFKKIAILMTFILFSLLIIGCTPEAKVDPIVRAYNALEVEFTAPDTIDSVTQDVTLPTTIAGVSNLEITWTSENEDVISSSGVVTRQAVDTVIVLTAQLKIDDAERFKFFNITVLRLEDSQAPVIVGAKDIFLDLDISNPNYLSGVYATDNIDTDVEVTFDASDVNLSVEGTYDLTYYAEDSAGNSTEITVMVTVVDEPMLTIQAAASSALDTHVKTSGTITAIYETENQVIFYIEDHQTGIRVEAPVSFLEFISFGQSVVVRGSKDISGNQPIINDVRDVAVTGIDEIIIDTVNSNNLSSYTNKLVAVYGLVNETHTFIHTSYTLETLNGPLQLVIPDLMVESLKSEIQTKLRNLSFGLGVGVTGVVRTIGSNSHVLLTSPDQIKIESEVDEQEVLEVIQANVNIPQFSGTVIGNLSLLRNQDLLFGASVNYVSSNETVLSNNGQVSPLEDDTNVTLTYTLTFNGHVLETKTFSLIIQGSSNVYTGYYESLTGKTGVQIQIELTKIISNYTYRSYDAARYILNISDRDPNNSNNVILVYNRASVSGQWDGGTTWNREHTWPQSFLGTSHEKADLHNLKPADNGINSARSNYSFRDSVDSNYGLVPGGWFPGDEDKGDIARILFYMVTRYPHLNLGTMGITSELVNWHIEDPVDDFERNRNEVIYSEQDNRNPFIDHPELVHVLWSA
ncbi:MAG: endonuclease [Acholeplasma sp.]